MSSNKIPKEFYLENPACLDDWKFKSHFNAILMFATPAKILNGSFLNAFTSFFHTKEHKEVVVDLLRYVIDTTENPDDVEEVKGKLIKAMYEAGFFG